MNRFKVTGLLVIALIAFPGIVLAGSTLEADPATPNATSTHTATLEINAQDNTLIQGEMASSSDLYAFAITYASSTAPFDISSVSTSSVVRFGVDSTGDGVIDTSLKDEISGVDTSNDILKITGPSYDMGGTFSYKLNSGDVVIAEYGDVVNSSESESSLPIRASYLNPLGEQSAVSTLSIANIVDSVESTGSSSGSGSILQSRNAQENEIDESAPTTNLSEEEKSEMLVRQPEEERSDTAEEGRIDQEEDKQIEAESPTDNILKSLSEALQRLLESFRF